MIGQVVNREFVDTCRQNHTFPRFMIITGEKGSGKKTLAEYIAKSIGGFVVHGSNSVDSVREVIEQSYKCKKLTTFIFSDTDNMSPQAKNALLKVTEEPPYQAHFIMTVEDIGNTLATLKSRGAEIKMGPYTHDDLMQFSEDSFVLDIATNPGQALELMEMDVEKFWSFCMSILDNIGEITGVNALKIGSYMKFKEEDTGYNIHLFFNCLMSICFNRMTDQKASETELKNLGKTVTMCSKYKNMMSITGIRKDAVFDEWIREMRKVWCK